MFSQPICWRRRLASTVLTLTGLLLASRPLPATAGRADSSQSSGFGFFLFVPIEKTWIRNGLDDALRQAGLPECRYPALSAGIGLQAFLGRSVLFFSYGKATRRPPRDSSGAAVEYRALSLGAGYDLLRRPCVSLYPFVGFRGLSTAYEYRQQQAGATSLNSYLAGSYAFKELRHSRAHLDLGGGFSYQTFFLLGLRAGVLLPLEKSRWYTGRSRQELAGAPETRYQWYLSLTLGIGGMDAMRRPRHPSGEPFRLTQR